MRTLLVALLLLYPLTVMAETYEWTDQEGTVHFAEDLGKVPKKYRKKAKRLGEEETVQTSIINEPAPAAAKPKGAEPEKGNKVYDGKEESAWRKDVANAKRELQACESSVSELQGRLKDSSKMSRSEYLAIQNTLRHEENRMLGLRKKVQQLEESADRAGVPKEGK